MRRIAGLTILLLAALVACEGPMGPEGPQGPQGEPGPQGPQGPAGEDALIYDDFGQLNSQGSVSMGLPASLVNEVGLPSVSCWVSSNAETWLAADHTPSDSGRPYCGITGVGSSSPAVTIASSSGFSGYYYFIVAVF